MERMKIIAHRGFKAELPENTLPSFRKAFESGFNSVELDVHLTKDDQVIVTHDFTLSRRLFLGPDGRPPAEERPLFLMSYSEILEYECGRHRDLKTGFPRHRLQGVRVPLLRDVLDLQKEFPGLEIDWNVEIKYSPVPGTPSIPHFVGRVLGVLADHEALERATIYSFSRDVLKEVKRRRPGQKINFLYEARNKLGKIGDLLGLHWSVPDWGYCARQVQELGAEVFSPHYRFLEIYPGWKKYFSRDRRSCLLYVWTCNDVLSARRMLQEGDVDGIITDEPEKLAAALEPVSGGGRV